MALPVGISTCTITAGSLLDFDGTGYALTVQVEPILGGTASKKAAIVWEATGQPLVNFTETYESAEGMPVTFALPHVDQPGFINSAGEAFTMWSYRATIEVKGGDRSTYRATKNFQVLVGQTSVDLDLVPDGSITAPSSAPIPAVLSVGGQTGAVDLDALNADLITTPGTATALSLAAKISADVPPIVTTVLAEDTTVAQAAATAVENGLDDFLTASDKLARLYAASATIGFQSAPLVDNRAGAIGNSAPATRRFILNSPIAANTVIEAVAWYAKFAISAQYIELWEFSGDTATLVNSAGPFNLSTVGEHTIDLNWLTGAGSYRIAFRSAGSTNGTLMTGAPTNQYLYSEDLTATSYTISTGLISSNLSIYAQVKILRAVPGDVLGRTHTVSPTPGAANFETIQAAVNAASDGDTILIYPGTYRESVAAWGKHNLHFVGVSRDNVIIIDSSGAYSTPPLEIDSGSVRNMTIIEDHATAGTDAAAFEDQRAYSVHPDYPDQAGRTLIIEDCTIRNTRRTAIGCGLWQDNTVIVRRCDIWAGAPVLGDDRNRGAIYFHNRQSSTTVTTNQHLILEDNRVFCEDAKVFYLYDSGLGVGMQQSVMDVLAIRNTIWSEISGASDPIGGHGFTDDVTLHPASYGNNVAALNA